MSSEVMTEGGFKAQDISIRAQKKLLSKMSGSKSMTRVFIDEQTSSLLDSLYDIAKRYTNDKKESEKLIKNIIKTVIKFAILYRNEVLSEEQKNELLALRSKVKGLALNIITFFDVEFTFDKKFLSSRIRDCEKLVLNIAQAHLTANSVQRINKVFSFFSNEALLTAVFEGDAKYIEPLSKLVRDLNFAIDKGIL